MSGATNTYDGNLFQFGTTSNGTVTPAVNLPFTTEGIRGLAVDNFGYLYVGAAQRGNINGTNQLTGGYVRVFASGLSASSVPVRTIPLPGVDAVEAMTVDTSGQLYVLSSYTGSVYVFNSNSTLPVRTITGSNTGLTANCFGIAVDPAGQIYVSSFTPSKVLMFSAGANGNVAPVRTLTISAGGAYGMAVDSLSNLYVVANDTTGTTGNHLISQASILKFAPGSTTPGSTIQGSSTTLSYGGCMSIDAAGNLWLVNLTQDATGTNSQAVVEFGAGASGNTAPLKNFTSSVLEPYGSPSIAVQ